MQFTTTKYFTDQKIFTIHINKNVYIGGTSTCLLDVTVNKILYKHNKSVTHISSSRKYLTSSSYDCTASIFLLNAKELEDVIEGPDTEIKCISIDPLDKWIALATRGKSVWVCRIGENIEINNMLEDHTEDVKGCLFHEDMLFSFGYDNSIKCYKYFKMDESWEMVQSISENDTVWNLAFIDEKMFSCNGQGEVSLYILDKGWTIVRKKKLSNLPIFALCAYKNMIICGIGFGNLIFMNTDLEVVYVINKLHDNFINCIYWSEEDDMIGTCSDDMTYCLISEKKYL